MLRYVQSQDGVFVRHINDIDPTYWDADHFCLARKLTEEEAAYFGVTKLKIVTPPYFNPATQKRDEADAVLIDGVWTQQYVVTEMDAEEAAEKTMAQAVQVRAQRTKLLAECDWTQLIDSPADKGVWAAYRTALRDVTAQEGFPWDVIWPISPR